MRERLDAYLRELTEGFAHPGGYEPPRAPRTAKQYRHKLTQFLDWLGEREPTPAVLHAYRLHRQTTQGRRPRTIRVDFTAIFGFFAFLERHGARGLPRRGCIRLPQLDDAQRESPTAREVEAMFASCARMPQNTERRRYLRGRALGVLTLLAYAGLRHSELLALNVSDVWQDGQPWIVYVREGKGAQPRQIALGDAAQGYLREWLATRRRWCFLHQCEADALFPVDRARRLSHLGLKTVWGDLLELAGIERRLTPHGMRHWYGSCVEESEGLKTAQEMLGHKRTESTLGYLKTNVEKKARAANTFGRTRPPETQQVPVSSGRTRRQGRGGAEGMRGRTLRRLRGEKQGFV